MLVPMVLAAALYLSSTTGRAVIDYDEGYYAQAAKHMVESGDWVTPHANGVRFLEKPPLLYWLTAASFSVFGINEIALRLPTALAVIALVWIVMRTARRTFGGCGVMAAGLSTACSAGTYLFTRETLHDVWLVLFIALAMDAFAEWRLDPRRPLRPALVFYAAAAGAMMCKSLIGVAFPAGIVLVFHLLSREWPEWRKMHLLPGSALFLLLTAPWHWLAEVRNEGFLNFFFVGEQFLRFFSHRDPPVLWSVPLLAFWGLVLVWFFPWTAFLPAALLENRKSEDPRRRVIVRLAVAWAVVILGFFSLTDRLEHYAFPALPALSLLIAGALDRSGERRSIRMAYRALAVLGIVVLAAGVAGYFWIAAGNEPGFSSDGPQDRLSEADFSILADIPPAVAKELVKPAAVTVPLLGGGFLAAAWFDSRRRRMHAVLCLALAMAGVCGMIHWSFSICEDLISSKRFGVEIRQAAQPGDRLVVVDDYEAANSLNFYQPLHVEIVDGMAYALVPGLRYPDAPKTVLRPEEFAALWNSEARVFTLVPRARLGELNPAGTEMLGALHRVLVRNR